MVQQANKKSPENKNNEQKNKYELMVIIIPDLTEDEIEKQLNKVRKDISDLKGEIYHEDLWDIRDLAYMIKKYDTGYYAVFYFTFDSENIVELEKELMLDSKVLRHLVVKSPAEYQIKKTSDKKIDKEKQSDAEKSVETAKTDESTKDLKEEPKKESKVESKDESKETQSEREEADTKEVIEEESVKEKKETEEKKEEKKETEEKKKPMDISDLDSQLESILEDPDIDIKL